MALRTAPATGVYVLVLKGVDVGAERAFHLGLECAQAGLVAEDDGTGENIGPQWIVESHLIGRAGIGKLGADAAGVGAEHDYLVEGAVLEQADVLGELACGVDA
jgi:hypothetical protein